MFPAEAEAIEQWDRKVRDYHQKLKVQICRTI